MSMFRNQLINKALSKKQQQYFYLKLNFYLDNSTRAKVTLQDFPNLAKVYAIFYPFRKTYNESQLEKIDVFYSDNLIQLPVDYYAIIESWTDQLPTEYCSTFDGDFLVLGHNSYNQPIVVDFYNELFQSIYDRTDEQYQRDKLECLHPQKDEVIQKDLLIGCLSTRR